MYNFIAFVIVFQPIVGTMSREWGETNLTGKWWLGYPYTGASAKSKNKIAISVQPDASNRFQGLLNVDAAFLDYTDDTGLAYYTNHRLCEYDL